MAFYNSNLKKTEEISIGLVLGNGTTFNVRSIIESKGLSNRIDYTKLKNSNFYIVPNAMDCNINVNQQGFASAVFTPGNLTYDNSSGTLGVSQVPAIAIQGSVGTAQSQDNNCKVILIYKG